MLEGGGVWWFEHFSKLKTALREYWPWIKNKFSKTWMSKEYEIKSKLVQKQWLQLRIKSLLGYNFETCYLVCREEGAMNISEGWSHFWLVVKIWWINSTDESIQLTKWRQILAIIINLSINDCVRFLKATPLNFSENALKDFFKMSCEQGNSQLHAVPINIF